MKAPRKKTTKIASGIILAATDFSAASRSAVNYAAELALSTKSRLVLMHVFLPAQMVAGEFGMLMPEMENVEMKCLKRLYVLGRTLQAKFGTQLDIALECRSGLPVEQICRFAEYRKAKMVVVGKHGGSGTAQKLFGTTSTGLIHQARIPVLTIRKGQKYTRPEKIVLAADLKGTLPSRLISSLDHLGRKSKTLLEVVHVTDKNERHPLDQLLGSMQLKEQLSGIRHSFAVINGKDPVKKIRQHAKKENADVLVMLPRKHGFWNRLINGSETSRMALSAGLPLLTLNEN